MSYNIFRSTLLPIKSTSERLKQPLFGQHHHCLSLTNGKRDTPSRLETFAITRVALSFTRDSVKRGRRRPNNAIQSAFYEASAF